jgi:hypothetical protein
MTINALHVIQMKSCIPKEDEHVIKAIGSIANLMHGKNK